MASINLVSVNTAPERAKKVIGTVIEQVKTKYNIVHAGNAEGKAIQASKKTSLNITLSYRRCETSTEVYYTCTRNFGKYNQISQINK